MSPTIQKTFRLSQTWIKFNIGTCNEVTEDCDTAFGWKGDWGGDDGDHKGEEEHELRSSFSAERSRVSVSLM